MVVKILNASNKINSVDGIKLYYIKNIPKFMKAIILIIHGFSEHVGKYDYIKNKLIQCNYGIYRYDVRGHGRSEGKRGYIRHYNLFIEDLKTIIKLIKYENPDKPIFVLGFSMGAFIALSYGINDFHKIDGQILSSPAVIHSWFIRGLSGKILEYLSYICPNIKIKTKLHKFFLPNDTTNKSNENDKLVLNQATLRFYVEFLVKGSCWLNQNINKYKVPCLLLHGEEDYIIDKKISINLFNKISSQDKQLKIYSGLKHEIINNCTENLIVSDVDAWINSRIDII